MSLLFYLFIPSISAGASTGTCDIIGYAAFVNNGADGPGAKYGIDNNPGPIRPNTEILVDMNISWSVKSRDRDIEIRWRAGAGTFESVKTEGTNNLTAFEYWDSSLYTAMVANSAPSAVWSPFQRWTHDLRWSGIGGQDIGPGTNEHWAMVKTPNVTGVYELDLYDYESPKTCTITQQVLIKVDATPPAINLNSPLNNLNSSSSTINFNWTAIDNMAENMTCNLTIDGVVNVSSRLSVNNTPTNQTVIGISEGVHSWNITCIDSVGNRNNSLTRTFTIDTIAPSLSIIAPINITYNNATQLLNISASDSGSGLRTRWYRWNGTNYTYTSLLNITFNEGSNTLHAWANDSAGNVNYTSVTFTIDTTGPLWSNPSVNETTIYNNQSVKFNATWTNTELAGYIFSINQTGSWINSSYIPFSGAQNVSENISLITANAGTNIGWYFWANDSVGNSNQTDIQSFIVQSKPTTLAFSVNQTTYAQGPSPDGYNIYIPFQARYLDNLGNPISGATCYVTNNETSDNVTLTYNLTTGNYTGEINDYLMYNVVGFNATCSKTNYDVATNSTSANVWFYAYLWETENLTYGYDSTSTTHWLRREPSQGPSYTLSSQVNTIIGENLIYDFPIQGSVDDYSFMKDYNMLGFKYLKLNISINDSSCNPYLCFAVKDNYLNTIGERCGEEETIPINTPTLLSGNYTHDCTIAQGYYAFLRLYLNCSSEVTEDINIFSNYTGQPANLIIPNAQPSELLSEIIGVIQLDSNYTLSPNNSVNSTRRVYMTLNNTLSYPVYKNYIFFAPILIDYPDSIVPNTTYIYNSTGQLWASDNLSAGAPQNVTISPLTNRIKFRTETVPAESAINGTGQAVVLNALRNNETLVTDLSYEKQWNISVFSILIPQIPTYNLTVWTNYSTYGVPDDFNFSVTKTTNGNNITDITDNVAINATTKILTMPMTNLSGSIVYTITATDITPPTVHLISPANNSLTNQALQNFSCNISNIEISNLTLKIWNSTNNQIYSNTTDLTGTFNETNWEYSLPYDDLFKWDCLGYDAHRNSNYSNEGNYTLTLDATAPTLSIISPTNTTYTNATQLVNISSNGDNIWYNWNGTNITYTSEEYVTFDEGSNTLHAWANDSTGNLNYTNVTFTIDTTAPEIEIISPENTTYNNATQLLNISVQDSSLDSIWYNWNGTNVTYTSEEYITFDEGSNTFEAWANDTFGQLNYTNVTFTIDTTAPEIEIISPENTIYNNTTQLVNISSNGDNIWYNWNGTNYTYTSPLNITFNEGSNTLHAWANDTFGNLNYTSVTFIIDTTTPEIEIISPENTTYNNATQLLNISVVNNSIDTIWYNWNGTNATYTGEEYITFDEGFNILYAWVNDSAENIYFTDVAFTIDTTAPEIEIISPENTTYNNATQLLNISVQDSSLDSIWYNWNGTNVTYTSEEYITFDEGSNTFEAWANDTFGNLNYTSVTFIIDTTFPIISSTGIFPYATINGSEIPLFISASNFEDIWAEITKPDSNVENVTLTNNDNTTFSNTSLIGRYNVTFYASNSSKNASTYSFDYFETFEPFIFTFVLVDYNLTGIDSNCEIIYRDNVIIINESSSGNYSVETPQVIADLRFKSYSNRLNVIIKGIDIVAENGKTFGMDKLSIPISGYLVTYGINNSYSFSDNATIRVYYDDISFGTEGNLKLYKCDDWNFENQTCSGTFSDITSSSIHNTGEDYFEYETDSFSGFAIKEIIPVTPPSTGGGGGCTSKWNCTEWSECTANGIQTRVCTDLRNCRTERNKPIETQSCVPVKEITEEPIPSPEPEYNVTPAPPTPLPQEKPEISKINYKYLLIGIVLFLVIIIFLIRRRKTYQKRYFHAGVYKTRIKSNLRQILSKNYLRLFFNLILIIILSSIIYKSITGFVVNSSSEGVLLGKNWFIFMILIFGILAFIYRGKIRTYAKKLKEKIRELIKGYPENRVKGLIKKSVYTEEGEYLGKVEGVFFGKNKIDSLKIKLGRKHKFRIKRILIKYRNMVKVGHIIIINLSLNKLLKYVGSRSNSK